MNASQILTKLRIKSGQRAIVLGAPNSYRAVLEALPEGIQLAEALEGKFDFIHYFAASKAQLESTAPNLKTAMKPEGILWISYPKGTAIATDLKRDIVREVTENIGLKAVTQVAIDDIWSALRFKIP
ncbi:MAG: hypothetical protein HYU86_03980 [Chloroflexi bacterium]|nr:hypothetical protein [Chloroflexota bacterium]